ncbi:MAG: response regulator [Armatimonadetes bacterium]|nr:response regulator [Armatimonadota bacterium]MBS1726487.1 response regulator [Armatimonadota bacterium]
MAVSGHFSPKVLVVDDDTTNLHYLLRLLNVGGYDDVRMAMSGREAVVEGAAFNPDIILLDLQIPELDGFEVLKILRPLQRSGVYLPILVFTAQATHNVRKRALELGATDFLAKPLDSTEILLRMRNFVSMRYLSKELNERNIDLEERVREHTRELEQSYLDIIHRLSRASEYRDNNDGDHTRRISELSAKIASALGLSSQQVRLIKEAALLHDLGKVGVPDSILTKNGRLSRNEESALRKHCEVGASILANSRSPLLQVAERIAAHHHERYDGKGYPSGLRGEEIPIEARVVALADAYQNLFESFGSDPDALERAKAEIVSESGSRFDPAVVEAFVAVRRIDFR